ncbi:unnamed protein product, partial [Sphacelaria rigidula]
KQLILNWKLQETVFGERTPDFETSGPAAGQPHVTRLCRALHDFRQSSNVRNFTIDAELRRVGFTATTSDPCVSTRG